MVKIQVRNPIARRRALQREITLRGTVSVSELCELFDASAPTIRRDLDALAEDSLVRRTHGGAEICQTRRAELDFAVREKQNVEGKQAIARAAMALIQPGDTLFMNDGSTMLALAREIVASNTELFVVTPALNLASLMVENPRVTVCLTGGFVSQRSLSVTGPHAQSVIDKFNANLAFLSSTGFSVHEGLSYVEPGDAELAREFIAHAKRSVALITGDKLEDSARATAAAASDLDLLITDRIDPILVGRFEECGLEVTEALGHDHQQE